MFVDSSVVVALISEEDDAPDLLRRLEAASSKVTSALVLLESVMLLSTKMQTKPADVETAVLGFFERAQIAIVPLGEAEARTAIQAFALYGKGRGHPAQLNIADCLSYGCAKSLRVPLLYKGDDFAKTDLA